MNNKKNESRLRTNWSHMLSRWSRLLRTTRLKIRSQKTRSNKLPTSVKTLSSGLMLTRLLKRMNLNTRRRNSKKFVLQSSPRCTKEPVVCQVVCQEVCPVECLAVCPVETVLMLVVLHLAGQPLKKSINRKTAIHDLCATAY